MDWVLAGIALSGPTALALGTRNARSAAAVLAAQAMLLAMVSALCWLSAGLIAPPAGPDWLTPVRAGVLAALFVAVLGPWLMRLPARLGLDGFGTGMDALRRVPTGVLALGIVVNGFAEEMLYRFVALSLLASATGSIWMAAALVILSGALAHWPLWGGGTVADGADFGRGVDRGLALDRGYLVGDSGAYPHRYGGPDPATTERARMSWIDTEEALEALYDTPVGQAALDKVARRMTPGYRAWIARARFCLLATVGPEGTDCSPRGDDGPVVAEHDPGTLLLPDWRGNNRIDTLRNIVRDGRISLTFLIPGATNVIRVNGTARISTDPALIGRFEQRSQHPRSVIVIAIDEIYAQCARSVMRADLWNRNDAGGLPSMGTILTEMTEGAFDGAGYDRAWGARAAETMW